MKSECCDDDIWGTLGDGVFLGTCAKCRKIVIRVNPRTGKTEWLDGESPWSNRNDLREYEEQEHDDVSERYKDIDSDLV